MKKRNGFTLIELLAVIAVIAILTIIAVPNVLKLYKESKKNTFIAEVRKTAKSAQLEYAEGTKNTFDCNKDLSGQKYKECTGTVDEDEVTITALGDGAFSNFLMVDVTSEPDSGIFIDLDELNLIEVVKDTEFSESLIKDNSINPKFRSVTGKEISDKELEIYDIEITEDIQENINTEIEFIDKMRNNFSINDNKMSQKERLEYPKYNQIPSSLSDNLNIFDNNFALKINDRLKNSKNENNLVTKLSVERLTDKSNYTDTNLLVYELSFDDKMLGTYVISKLDFDYAYVIKKSELDDMIEDDNFAPTTIYEGQEITIDSQDKLYFFVYTYYGYEYEGLTIEKTSGGSGLKMIGKKSIDLDVKNVKKYKDSGITNKGEKLEKEGDFYSYNNIRERDGEFTYNYVVKTTEGVKILKRRVNVYNETSLDCFEFYLDKSSNTYGIDYYYDYEKNDPKNKPCPKKVYIPDKYNGLDIVSVYNYAFEDKGITSLRLPSKLEYISYGAFSENFLETVILPSTLEDMGSGAFYLNNITYVEYDGKSKFCYQDIAAQRYNRIFKDNNFDYYYSWNDFAYTGKTSKSFLVTCSEPLPK